jgi:outer membrane immunogenic protein
MHKTLLAATLATTGLLSLSAYAQDNTTTQNTTTTQDTTATQDNSTTQGNYQPDQAVGSGNWFIDANVGRTNGFNNHDFGNLSGFDFAHGQRGRRTGYGVEGGYRWKVGPDLGLGVEVGYADLGNYLVKNLFNSNPVNQTSSVNALHGWLVGVNGRLNLVQGWYLSARGGYFHANDYNHAYPYTIGGNLGSLTNGRAGHDSWYAGVGTGWDVNDHFGIGVQYDYFHANAGRVTDPITGATAADLKRSTGIASIKAEYRF